MLLILPDHDHDTCSKNTLLESNKGTNLSKTMTTLTRAFTEYGMSSTKGHNSFNQIKQSEHIGQCDTPHHRWLGGIGRVVPIVKLRCTQQLKSVDILSYTVTENKWQNKWKF